jgi:hypothetical protein
MKRTLFLGNELETRGNENRSFVSTFLSLNGNPCFQFYRERNEQSASFPFWFPLRFLFPLYRRETGNERNREVRND